MSVTKLDVEILNEHVKMINEHWIRLKGEIHNDKDFWNECLHA